MIARSRFKLWSLLPVALVIPVSYMLVWLVTSFYSNTQRPTVSPTVVPVLIIIFFLFVWIWLIFGELRTKVLKVWMNEDGIMVRNFFGVGTRKTYTWDKFDGYVTSLLPSRYGVYEYLYLVKGRRKVIKISEYYHRNYIELKEEIAKHTTDLKTEKYSLWREIKEVFL